MQRIKNNIDMDKIVNNILKQLNLKNKAALAIKLNISKNSLSNLITRKSLGTLIEKLIENKILVSFDQILYEVEYDFKKTIELKIQNKISKKEQELENLKSYLKDENSLNNNGN